MARSTKAEAQQTRGKIIDAAERLFVARGVSTTSLEHIAAAAHVTRGAIYWHFKNKADLYEAMHDRVKLPFDTLLESLKPGASALTQLQDACNKILQHVHSDERTKRVYSILLLKTEETSLVKRMLERKETARKELLDRFERFFTMAKKQGELGKNVKPKIAARALTTYLGGMLGDYVRMPKLYPIDAAAKEVIDIFFVGLRVKK